MKVGQFSYFGPPLEVMELKDIEDPPAPGDGEVGINVLYVPVNIGDLLAMEGRYGASAAKLPRIAGVEGLGLISSIGSNVGHVQIGDRVLLPPGYGTWCEKITAPAALITVLPNTGDAQQLCMMRANPASAYLMLKTFMNLTPGDWVIQNAANSAVGQYLIQLAKLQGFKTVNIVRRPRTVEPLKDLGANIVLVDGPDLQEKVAIATENENIKLGIDAVGGASTRTIGLCLGVGGTIVNYGLLGGVPCMVEPSDLIFREIKLSGFWRAKWQTTTPPEEVSRVTKHIVNLIVDGKIRSEIEAIYPFRKMREALHHAQNSDRIGKILLKMHE